MIYIVEDEVNILEIEIYALESSDFNVLGFSESQSFFVACEKEIPSLIILDIMLPGIDGFSILKKLKAISTLCDVPVLMLSAKGNELDKVKCLDLGADDYLTKPFGVLELISRVKAILRRSKNQDKVTYTYKNIIIDDSAHLVSVDNKRIELTYKEYSLLKYFISNQNIALTRDQIQDKVWDSSAEIESRTIDIHINTLRKKIGDSKANIIKTVRNIGYKLGE